MPATPSNAEPNAAAELPRRAALQLGLAASGLLVAGGLIKYLGHETASAVPTAFELDSPETYAVDTALHLSQAGAWLLRDTAGLYAIATRCPHLGCTVARQAQRFCCPCHGSEFAPDGQVQRGPATENLSYLKLTRSSIGRVVLHTDQTAEAAERLT
jgi:Rieske Fe-S protein